MSSRIPSPRAREADRLAVIMVAARIDEYSEITASNFANFIPRNVRVRPGRRGGGITRIMKSGLLVVASGASQLARRVLLVVVLPVQPAEDSI